jgi:hypothetical protein
MVSLLYVSKKTLSSIHFMLDCLDHPALRALALMFRSPGNSHFELRWNFEGNW